MESAIRYVLKCVMLIFLALIFYFGSAFSQLEKGNVRLGFEADVSLIEDANRAEFSIIPGVLVSDNIEIGGILGVIKYEDVDAFGDFGAGLIFHITPKKKIIPGVGLQVRRTFGWDDANFTTIGVLFNLEAFITKTWALSLSTGYERQDREWKGLNAFVINFGISTFYKK